jgi:hypothetical protein
LQDGFWRRVANGWQLKLKLSNDSFKKYAGLKEENFKQLNDYMKTNHNKEIQVQELR